MSVVRVGQTKIYKFQTKNKSGQLYDPVTVQASVLKGNGSEDVLTYGGISARDSWLTKLATGWYQVEYTFDVSGETRISKRWSDDSFVTDFREEEIVLQVFADPHGWEDSSAAPVGTHYVYYGVGAAGINSQATLEAMTRATRTTHNFTATLSPTSQKVYICHPASWGVPLITLDGFAIDELATSTVGLHDYSGSVVDYLVHETTNLLTDTGLVFVVNF